MKFLPSRAKTSTLWSLLLLMITASWIPNVSSEEEASGAVVKYITFEPDFVVNYGDSGRLKFIRTSISLKMTSIEATEKVTYHEPYIRNNLVLLFSAQDPETMNTPQGREALRRKALEDVQALMIRLEEAPCVDDLYFNNFVVQG
ncbi:MAG: flagellar basal body-associated FliL family protein [Oleibacter sp.]|nr:flagellar basal body-associated FliL family protein [Thalassolituus sp.]